MFQALQKLSESFSYIYILLFILTLSTFACGPRTIPVDLEQNSSIATTLWLEKHYGILNNPEVTKLLARITDKLSHSIHRASLETHLSRVISDTYAGFPWQVYVLDTDDPNAFCAGAGNIFVTRGLIETLHSEAQLAAILAHEMSHQLLGHPAQAISQSGLKREAPEFHFSLEQEIQADLLGLQLMKVARYDLQHAADALSLAYRPEGDFVSREPKWLRERMAALQRQLALSSNNLPSTQNTREFNRVKRHLAMQ